MDISRDEKFVVSAGQDRRTILWEINDKKLEFSFRKEGESSHSITCFCLSKDEKCLVLGADDRKIRVWIKNNEDIYVPDSKWIAHKESVSYLLIALFKTTMKYMSLIFFQEVLINLLKCGL